jgi:fumarate reductase iron-sulfur subunit
METKEFVSPPGQKPAQAADPGKTLKVRVWRGAEQGSFATYEVPWRENQTVLDVVTEIQRRIEPDLAYRFSCRVGVCGTCAMTVNGKPRWTCRTHVSSVARDGVIELEPMRNMPRIKDLVVDMTEFFDKWLKAGGRFIGKTTRKERPAAIDPASKERKLANAAIECINCGICYAACDVVEWNKDYLGPAALNRAWSLVNDVRHADIRGVIKQATADGGCNSCHTQGSCMTHCPVGLSPTGSIAGLKKRALLEWFRRD